MAIQLAELKEAWIEATAGLDDFDSSEDLDTEVGGDNMAVVREDPHEVVLACRLFNLPPRTGDGEEFSGPSEASPEMGQVEERLQNLERRLYSSPLQSIKVFRSMVVDNPVAVDPKILARDLLTSPAEAKGKLHTKGEQEATCNDIKDTAATPSPELILVISLYSSSRGGIKTQTFEVHASTLLSEFRDRLTCVTDRVVAGLGKMGTSPKMDASTIDAPCSPPSMPWSLSAYFLIEGVFYSDLRSPGANDLSQCIREWIGADAARMAHFSIETKECKRMNETRWLEIPLTLGRPYSFLHCGRCDHHIVVEKVRLEHRYDRARTSLLMTCTEPLPLIREVFRMRRRRRKCRICEVNRAAWITVNDRLAPENPCSFCDACYRALHYDLHGKLVYHDFRVYPYYYEYN